MTKKEIIELIKEEIKKAEEKVVESTKLGIEAAGFNYDCGYLDALVMLLTELESTK